MQLEFNCDVHLRWNWQFVVCHKVSECGTCSLHNEDESFMDLHYLVWLNHSGVEACTNVSIDLLANWVIKTCNLKFLVPLCSTCSPKFTSPMQGHVYCPHFICSNSLKHVNHVVHTHFSTNLLPESVHYSCNLQGENAWKASTRYLEHNLDHCKHQSTLLW